jgi:anti-sigma B factor antagonist
VNLPWRKTVKTASLDGDIRATCEHQGSACQVSLSGRITIDTSPGLRARLLQSLQSPLCQSLTVDFYEVGYVDTSGLATLVEILKAARTQGKTFHLSRLRERPRYLLEATRLLHLFDEMQSEMPRVNSSSPERP